jgi:hypothetical protein
MAEIVKLDGEPTEQVTGGYGFSLNKIGEHQYMVRPSEENEKIKVVNGLGEVTLTSRKVCGELIWDVTCAGANIGPMKYWSIYKGGYMEDEYGNKIDSNLNLK